MRPSRTVSGVAGAVFALFLLEACGVHVAFRSAAPHAPAAAAPAPSSKDAKPVAAPAPDPSATAPQVTPAAGPLPAAG